MTSPMSKKGKMGQTEGSTADDAGAKKKAKVITTQASIDTIPGEEEDDDLLYQSEAPLVVGKTFHVDYDYEIDHVINTLVEGWASDVKLLSKNPVDKGYISCRELNCLIEDPKLSAFLVNIGKIRKDQMVMLFQKLDVMSEGRVPMDQFIEGLQRMKTVVQGIDVASAKSIMRRLYFDSEIMAKESLLLNEAFLDVVCHLRGVSMVGTDKGLEDVGSDDEDEAHDLIIEARERLLHEESSRLKKRIENLKVYADSRRLALETRGDSHVGVSLGLLEEEEATELLDAESDKD